LEALCIVISTAVMICESPSVRPKKIICVFPITWNFKIG
jgi:hypothetical protein